MLEKRLLLPPYESDLWHFWETACFQYFSCKKDLANNFLPIALEISTELPSEEELVRWCGEPVKAAILPTSLFLTNKKGQEIIADNLNSTKLIFICSFVYWKHQCISLAFLKK